MKTNPALNDKLIEEAMRLTFSTKKEVITLALQNLVAQLKRQEMSKLFGKVNWEGNLAEMRES